MAGRATSGYPLPGTSELCPAPLPELGGQQVGASTGKGGLGETGAVTLCSLKLFSEAVCQVVNAGQQGQLAETNAFLAH